MLSAQRYTATESIGYVCQRVQPLLLAANLLQTENAVRDGELQRLEHLPSRVRMHKDINVTANVHV